MEKFNAAFKTLADKMHLPAFFKSNTLLFNNLFLLLFAVLILIALLLVIFLVPVKKKKKGLAVTAASKEEKAQRPDAPKAERAEESADPVKRETKEDAPDAESPAVILPAEEPSDQETIVEQPVEQEEKQEIPVERPTPEQTPDEEQTAAPIVDKKEKAMKKPEEKKTKPVAKKEAEKAPAKKPAAAPAKSEPAGKSGGKYEIVKKNGSFFFLLKANNGQLLLESTGYTTEQGAKKAIETFKNAVENGEFKVDEDKNGNYKFILRASARSQMLYYGESYSTRQSAESAIGSVKNFALRAVVKRTEENDEGGDKSVGALVVKVKPLKASEHKLGGKYEITERKGSYYFLLKANNGQLLLESPAYTTEQGAKGGIESFKKAAEGGVYSIDEDKNGNFRFILRANDRAQVRYFGESYSTRQSAENSVNSVRAFAQKAVLK